MANTKSVPHLVGIIGFDEVGEKEDIAWFGEISGESMVELNIERLTAEIKRYYTGEAIYDHQETGLNIHLKFGLDDYSLKGIKKANKWLDPNATDTLLRFRSTFSSLREKGFAVVLRPYNTPSDDSQDKVLYLCNSTSGVVMEFTAEAGKYYEVEYQAYPILIYVEETVDGNTVKNLYTEYGRYGPWVQDFVSKGGHFFTEEETFDGVAV